MVVVSAVDVEVEGPSSRAGAADASSVSGACLRLRDLSWARRALRSFAAAESFSWDDIVSCFWPCVYRDDTYVLGRGKVVWVGAR